MLWLLPEGKGKGNTAKLGEALHCTQTHTHTPESLFLYPKRHTHYQPHQDECVPYPEREKDGSIVPCNDAVCSQREQQREHQKTAVHHKVTEGRAEEGDI